VYILVILYCGSIEFVKLCLGQEHARAELAEWVQENWISDEETPDDFETDEMIEWFFDHYEDYSCYREPIVQPGEVPGPFGLKKKKPLDILLTPGMCAIVREGLEHVDFVKANEILMEREEWDETQDNPETGSKLIIDMIGQFE
jgi:hypothetical protein